MKILYIANIRIPTEKAHGLQIMKMCESFVFAGVEVKLILPTRKNSIQTDPFEYYGIKDDFELKKLKSFDPDFLIPMPAGYYIKAQFLIFIKSLFFYLIFKKNKKNYIFYTRDEMLLPVLQLFSKKVVWESHALPNNKKRYFKYWKKCYKIFCLTNQVKNDLIKLGICEDKIVVSPDAVDLKIFDIPESKEDARKKLNLPQDKIILGYTGSFKTKGMDKGIADIIKALSIIDKKRQDVIFYSVGGSQEDIEFYKKIARDYNILEKLFFIEKVSQKEVALYQKAFDILLMPFPFNQHYAYYMSPLKMFEYMAAHRPIIASDLPSIHEILNEKNCLFCRSDDPKDLAEKIDYAIVEKVELNKLASVAFNSVKEYTWLKRASNIISWLN